MVTVGELIAGRYRVLHPLATGGMSRLWLAHDEVEDTAVALKKCALPEGLSPDEEDVFRVWTAREARSFTLVDHPNVVRTLDVLPADDAPWIVMEFVPCRSLQQVLDESGPLPPARVAGIGLAVLEGLLAVRRAGLLHLDIKPSNVLIATDGRVMLSDFGPAVTSEGVHALAGAGIVLGSPKYLAPERLLDGVALPESDLWSLGATLYHAVEGRPPFVRASTTETLLALAEETPEPPRQAGPLTELIVALLRRNPAARPEPAMVEAALRSVTGQPAAHPDLHPEPSARRASRKGGLALAAALAVILAVAAAVVVLRPDDRSGTPAVAASPAAPARGWYWYVSGTGMRVMLPLDLKAEESGLGLAAADYPNGPRLRAEPLHPTPPNLIEALTEMERLRSMGVPGYRRIRIEQGPGAAGADWEYTAVTGPSEIHGIQRLINRGGQVYWFSWEVPANAWASELPRFTEVMDSFQAPPGG
ncbi:hypothetical protein BJ973_005777 [Actinoplanes tereljensis]|uniref:non-specific serine/threonine protein kinase n=1 Tax=Paractinoplanes tereljensis TaxID=571912 RepID=A0A919NZC3_9ACTN|nr:serine/threonine-protein kinase [Actinoplanes tereljensis]GIF26417.1 hypothetical protein Ate02nite_91470 [Actinoplanes tereljensis]